MDGDGSEEKNRFWTTLDDKAQKIVNAQIATELADKEKTGGALMPEQRKAFVSERRNYWANNGPERTDLLRAAEMAVNNPAYKALPKEVKEKLDKYIESALCEKSNKLQAALDPDRLPAFNYMTVADIFNKERIHFAQQPDLADILKKVDVGAACVVKTPSLVEALKQFQEGQGQPGSGSPTNLPGNVGTPLIKLPLKRQ